VARGPRSGSVEDEEHEGLHEVVMTLTVGDFFGKVFGKSSVANDSYVAKVNTIWLGAAYPTVCAL
jgi:hypothetical protein